MEVTKSTIFWTITQCCPLKVNLLFGAIYHLHLQSRISRTRYQRESFGLPPLLGGYLSRIVQPLRWGRYVAPKHRFAFNRLHDVVSQKVAVVSAPSYMHDHKMTLRSCKRTKYLFLLVDGLRTTDESGVVTLRLLTEFVFTCNIKRLGEKRKCAS
jgi:hypothetical protein